MKPQILRPYQQQAVDAWHAFLADKGQRGMMVAATGTGKTTIIGQIVSDELRYGPERTALVLAHREEILGQIANRCSEMTNGESAGTFSGSAKCQPGTRIVAGSVQSLGIIGSTALDWLAPSLVVADECHHAAATTWQNAFKRFGCYDAGGTPLLGVTATPHRLDNLKLAGSGGIFEAVVFKYDIIAAIKDGFLVNLRGYRAKADFDLDGVRTVHGDYDQGQLEKRVNTEPVNELAFKSWAEVALERPTIVFCAGVDHAKAMAEIFIANGITAAAVYGDMPQDARKAAIQGFQEGRIQVLCNRDILTEGFDAWRCSAVLMIRPTQSWSLFTQCVGRGLRHLPGIVEGLGTPVARREAIASSGKPDCIVIDIVGATQAHELGKKPGGKETPSIQGLFDLPECMDLNGKSVADAIEEFEQLPDIIKAAAYKRKTDFSGLSAVLTQVEMLSELGVPDEVVEAGGQLYWMQVGEGHLILDCGFDDGAARSAVITTDLLGHAMLRLVSKHRDEVFALPDNPSAAILAAEKIIKENFFGVSRMAAWDAPWRKAAVTDAQRALLIKLGIDPEVVATLDRGKASAFITHLQRNRKDAA